MVTDKRFLRQDEEVFACVPGAESELTDCYLDLAARDVAFEPAVIRDSHPEGQPDLECHVEDPVFVPERLRGVQFHGDDPFIASCDAVHSLVDTVEYLADQGVKSVRVIDAYHCRVVKGTDKISSHSFGWGLDLSVFKFRDGRIYSLTADWELGNPEPVTEGGQFLYDAAHTFHESGWWHRVLTPEFNEAHSNHIHVDLSPTQNFIK